MYLIEDIVKYKPDNKQAIVQEVHQQDDGTMRYIISMMGGKKEIAIDEELEYVYDKA